MNRTPTKWPGRFLAPAFLLAVAAFGQSTAGTISGIVEDNLGTRIAGATVEIVSLESSVSRTVTTNSTGFFAALQLPPGIYTITVAKEEFKKLVKNQVVLTAANHLSVGTVLLEAGVATETITQTADAGQLDTQSTSGERSALLTNEEIRDLSLNGRNMLDLLVILPGVTSFVNGEVSSRGGLNLININGTRRQPA